MEYRTLVSTPIPELTTPTIRFQIVDGDGIGFEPTTLVLTHYNKRDGEILNLRDGQDVKDTNGVTIAADGSVVWEMSAADLALVDDTYASETHVALFEWSWAAGLKFGKHEIHYRVSNLMNVP